LEDTECEADKLLACDEEAGAELLARELDTCEDEGFAELL
jgi:hypothetical protein